MIKKILVTGGLGYIGSHATVELIKSGRTPVIVDNLSNSTPSVATRIKQITGHDTLWHEGDLLDLAFLKTVFSKHEISAIMHFAALKSVGESTENPLRYYLHNLVTTFNLLLCMQEFAVNKFVFSSSAAVYGEPENLPVTEGSQVGTSVANPYGWTKLMMEQILRDVAASQQNWHVTILRYFNAVGAHPSGLLGESPKGTPANLLPYVVQAAAGQQEHLFVYGDDYDTPDGTGIRDYIHVVDLARGHIAALHHLDEIDGTAVYNLGTGRGVSVLELIDAFQKVNGVTVPYKIVPRRPGDIAISYADPTKAQRELGWEATLTIHDACRTAWQWEHARKDE
ncbi:MAG TPA: UDP-glucose 4-epimerase GalE [Candidatus Saccharimonadales bacterium]